MTDFCILDVETVANDRAEAYFLSKHYEAPANYKDPEKIAQAIAEKRARDFERSGLLWWTARIICVSAYRPLTEEQRSFFGDDERAVLSDLFSWFPEGCQAIGKSFEHFDAPMLIGRSIALDLGVPNFLRSKRMIGDVDHIFSFQASCDQRGKLSDYAFGMGIDGKLGHGSEVAGMHAEGRWHDIERYCRQDVAITAELLRRWCKRFEVAADLGGAFESA